MIQFLSPLVIQEGGIFLKQILFNLIFFSVEFVIFTDKALKPETRLFIGLAGVFLFWIGNLWFLHQTERKYFPENLKSAEDYQTALKLWQKKAFPFRRELRTAFRQLESFNRKQRTLTAFDNSFQDISHDAENYLFSNMRKLLHRIMILDFHENMQIHRAYLNLILHQNQKFLSQYDNFLNAVFQTDSPALPCLDIITETLREIRNDSF